MPHLSPMSWIIATTTFYLLLTMFMTLIWWQQPSVFPEINVKSNLNPRTWNWS